MNNLAAAAAATVGLSFVSSRSGMTERLASSSCIAGVRAALELPASVSDSELSSLIKDLRKTMNKDRHRLRDEPSGSGSKLRIIQAALNPWFAYLESIAGPTHRNGTLMHRAERLSTAFSWVLARTPRFGPACARCRSSWTCGHRP